LTTHADQVVELVELVEHHDLTEITLVGFSYGGFVTTVAGARLRTRLARLVYLDAFMPRAG
jgi:pimeloyl-ACP methyl ester carboxylesterase